MENKNKNAPHTQSSLLFKLPNSMLSFSNMNTSSILMPVAVDHNEDVQRYSHIKDSSEKLNIQSQLSSTAPKSICQLEQPLLMRKGATKLSVLSSAQISSESQTSLCSGPPVRSSSECALAPVSTTKGNDPLNIALQPCPGFEELFAECPRKERASSLSSANGTLNFGSSTNTSPAPVFCPVSSACHVSPPPGFSPRPCGEVYGFLPALNCEASVSNSEDSKLLSVMPNVFSSSNLQNCDIKSGNHIQSDIDFDYVPVKPHWLFEDLVESREMWYGFSEVDSDRLEAAYQQGLETVVPTDGGRFDVHLDTRLKKSVYFDARDLHVRRGTWFHETGSSMRYRPYDEDSAKKLEQHYFNCINSGQWQRRFNISGIGSFVFESAQVMLHYKNELEVWPSLPDSKDSPKIVKRGLPDGFEILPNESSNIDNLVFIVQGIGSFCDLRFRTVSQCVDGFRDIANKLIGTHFKNETEQMPIGRVEFLPVAWHAKLHTSDMGLDRRMQNITLPSIPKLRHFTNDTLIDILLYSSQSYCQSIIDTVACELNTMYKLFISRNLNFTGKVFVAGHSLGSLILFDILANQKSVDSGFMSQKRVSFDGEQNELETLRTEIGKNKKPSVCGSTQYDSNMESLLEGLDLKNCIETFSKERIDYDTLIRLSDEDLKNLSIPTGPREKLLNFIASEQSLEKSLLDLTDSCEHIANPKEVTDFKFGNVEQENEDSKKMIYPSRGFNSSMSLIVFPRLQFEPAGFFALGSPISMFLAVRGYDSISKDFKFPTCPAFFHIFHPYDPVAFRIEPLIDPNFTAKPVLIPHHKGRKRMHLEIRENVTKIATEIKQKLMDTMRFTWNSLSEFAKNHSFPSAIIEAEVDKLVEQEMSEPVESLIETSSEDLEIGLLNGGRRIDYVLQEKPIEALNDYVFALTSHATYWDSEDTVLMILREIYAMQGIVIPTQQVEHKSPQNIIICEDNASLESVAAVGQLDVSMDVLQRFDNIKSIKTSESPSPSVPSSSSDVTCTGANSNVASAAQNSQSSSTIPGSKHIGPPPLSGFVKRSLFSR